MSFESMPLLIVGSDTGVVPVGQSVPEKLPVASRAPVAGSMLTPAASVVYSQTFGTVMYNSGLSRDVDLTLFENVFGDNPGGSPRLFPGTADLNQRIMIARNKYIALKFTVPANFPLQTIGQYRFEETQPQTTRMSWTISKTCGDFSTSPIAPLTTSCIMNNGPVNSTLAWGYVQGASSRCPLEPGQTYFLNIIHAPLSNPASTYCAGTCGNTIQNQGSGAGWPTVIDVDK